MIAMGIAMMAVTSQATVLRVSNTDSSTHYATVSAAVEAAAEGDTIVIDGSNVSYGDVTLNKRVVLMGPGYWLRENGIATEAAYSAELSTLTTTEAGTVVTGIVVKQGMTVKGAHTIITRCYVSTSLYTCIVLEPGADNCVIHQNYLTQSIGNGTSGRDTYNHQITNNIWDTSLKSIHNSYVAFNTSFSHWGESVWSSTGNKIERNIVYSENFGKDDKENTYPSNYCIGNLLEDIKTDKDVRDAAYPTAAAGYGAFAGDTPYVISGIPAGPMIEEMTVPTMAEEGGTMQVTFKLGTAK